MTRILLIGYMGVGKTTIGRALALRLGLPFCDLDEHIAQTEHTTIGEIFSKSGEDGFRRIEQEMLHEVAQRENIVISCGGGTPCFFDNMDYMNRQGTTIYLKASPACVARYLAANSSSRPLLQGMTTEEMTAYIHQQMAQREPYYNRAKITINITVADEWMAEEEILSSLLSQQLAF